MTDPKPNPRARRKRYSFVGEGTISLSVDVEAESMEEAIRIAQRAGLQSLCHQCARGEDGSWNTSGELDCEPAQAALVQVDVDGEILEGAELAAVQRAWAE